MTESRHIVCPHCDSVNRLPADRDARQAKCGRCHNPIFTGGAIPVSGRSFDAHVRNNDIPVVADFWAQWCGPCKAMGPVYDRVAAEMEPNLRFLKVDTERESELAARYGIQAIPTLMVLRKGAVLDRRAGALDRQTLRKWLRRPETQNALLPARQPLMNKATTQTGTSRGLAMGTRAVCRRARRIAAEGRRAVQGEAVRWLVAAL